MSQTEQRPINNWAVGWTAFAAVLMIVAGIFHVFAGISVLVDDDELFVVEDGWVYEFNTTAWGWIHIIAGIVVVLAGAGLFSGNMASRVVAVILAVLSMLANFLWLPYYPIWSIIMIALAAAVIWAVTAHGEDLARSTSG